MPIWCAWYLRARTLVLLHAPPYRNCCRGVAKHMPGVVQRHCARAYSAEDQGHPCPAMEAFEAVGWMTALGSPSPLFAGVVQCKYTVFMLCYRFEATSVCSCWWWHVVISTHAHVLACTGCSNSPPLGYPPASAAAAAAAASAVAAAASCPCLCCPPFSYSHSFVTTSFRLNTYVAKTAEWSLSAPCLTAASLMLFDVAKLC